MHPLRQAIWGLIWKHTVEISQINAANATMHPLGQTVWEHIWKHTLEKSWTNVTSVALAGPCTKPPMAWWQLNAVEVHRRIVSTELCTLGGRDPYIPHIYFMFSISCSVVKNVDHQASACAVHWSVLIYNKSPCQLDFCWLIIRTFCWFSRPSVGLLLYPLDLQLICKTHFFNWFYSSRQLAHRWQWRTLTTRAFFLSQFFAAPILLSDKPDIGEKRKESLSKILK